MERLTHNHLGKSSLYFEHIHRYILVSKVVKGAVVDCACGVGYGSEFLIEKDINSYTGIDVDDGALKIATERYMKPDVSFEKGTLESLRFKEGSVDTFVSLETIEHLTLPEKAIAEVHRVLAKDGIFVGSVPAKEYEELCERIYGVNPYHLQKISLENLSGWLSKYFKNVSVYSVSYGLGSKVTKIYPETGISGDIAPDGPEGNLGSYFFVATNSDSEYDRCCRLLTPVFLFGITKAHLDEEEVLPIEQAVKSLDHMVEERDKALEAQAKMIDERDQLIVQQTKLIEERDKALEAQAKMIDERDRLLIKQSKLIEEKDRIINSQLDLVEKLPEK